ncbi:MAG: chemotaxis response regulator protein-glutamate methylesterase [Myxococcota bacterium]|nr:chemotaxis response regulator protein-glutamate methylesterase [Myxococcota bacterium]
MTTNQTIRVLVIDDSAFSRRTITRMLGSSPLVQVVGSARDGEEALRKAFELTPDLITLDLEMPRMDGFTFLRLLMAKLPIPVMVISSRSGESDVFKALDLGAVDFIAKPSVRANLELNNIQAELIRKVHAIRDLRIDRVKARISAAPPLVSDAIEPVVPEKTASDVCSVVAIGASTGGPAAIMQVLAAFSEPPSSPILIAQHMPAGFTEGFAERLNRLTCFDVREAKGGEVPVAGMVLLAPGGQNLEVESRGGEIRTRLAPSDPSEKHVPSVDRLFATAAEHYGSKLLGVVLTGMGDDGRRGSLAIKEHGGRVFAESEETAVIFGMPAQAIRAGAVDEVIPLHAVRAAVQSVVASDEAKQARGRGSL